jgi:HTH-type transcriptional regulator / antitoxin HipB
LSDLDNYIETRMIRDAEFADNFQEGHDNFRLGILLRQAREKAGLTQEEVALQIGTPPSTVSKIENHTDDVRLALIRRYAEALGKQVTIKLA